MSKDWRTKEKDLKNAAEIIEKHIFYNDGESLGLIDLIVRDTNDASLVIPEWLVELTDFFISQYGDKEGKSVTSKIVTQCLLAGQTIH